MRHLVVAVGVLNHLICVQWHRIERICRPTRLFGGIVESSVIFVVGVLVYALLDPLGCHMVESYLVMMPVQASNTS